MNHLKKFDRTFIRINLLQLSYFIAIGAAYPFFGIYYKHILTKPNGEIHHYLIGIIFFLKAISGIIATPVAGIITDKFKIQNRMLSLFSTVSGVASILIFLPGFTITAGWPPAKKAFFILSGVVLMGLFSKPITPLIDTETLNYLHKKHGNIKAYGRIRVLGTIGWIVSASFGGLLLTFFTNINVTIIFQSIVFFILALIAAGGFKTEIKPIKIPWRHLKDDGMYLLFLIFILIYSFGYSNSFIFTGYFMDDSHVNFLIIGLSYGLSAVPEVPAMILSRRIINKIGNRWMIVGGVGAEMIKLLLFVLISKTDHHFLFIFAHLLHGVGFGLYHVGIINLIDRRSHKDLRATYQNFYHLCWTIGSAFGSIFASGILKNLDSSALMLIDSAILGVSCLFFITLVKGHGPDQKKCVVIE